MYLTTCKEYGTFLYVSQEYVKKQEMALDTIAGYNLLFC